MRNLLAAVVLLSLNFLFPSYACTRILHVDAKQGVYVGRTMDWNERMFTNLVVFPRGLQREGLAPKNSLHWTSKYGSIVAVSYGNAVTDGMNEKGLAVHILWLDGTDYATKDQAAPGVSPVIVAQYYLDQFKTVKEVIAATQSKTYRVVPYFHPQTKNSVKLHFALEDATGDSAVIEYIHGEAKIYHNKKFTVMTNQPVYNVQLQNLKKYSVKTGQPLPGTASPEDRFVRAYYYEKDISAAHSQKEAVNSVLSVLENISSPRINVRTNSHSAFTLWRTIADLTHRIYYFNSTSNMNTVYAQLSTFNLQPGAPIMELDISRHPEWTGNVNKKFIAQNKIHDLAYKKIGLIVS